MGKFFRYRVVSEAAYANFAVDQAYGIAPTRDMGGSTVDLEAIGPVSIGFARITNIHFKLVPTNAVTYNLYLYQNSGGAGVQVESNKFFDSVSEIGANIVGNVEYLREVDRTVYIEFPGYVWYIIDWSAAPGDTTGYIEVCGERDG